MFRILARLYADPNLAIPNQPTDPGGVFATNPEQLARWLEEMWTEGGSAPMLGLGQPPAFLGDPGILAQLARPANFLRSGITAVGGPRTFDTVNPTLGTGLGFALPWPHLMYAALVESTGIIEIFTEVLRRYVGGESLEVAQLATHSWLRSTEELFFRDPPPNSIVGTVGELRPSARVNRRNTYWRMFGMDLPHQLPGAAGGPPAWKRETGQFVNSQFLPVWTELLRQVWLGIENDRNEVGANPTDVVYIGYLCESLSEMIGMRRRMGTLAREEFGYVAMMSWFHLAVETDTVIVQDLQANAGAAGDPGDRLARVAARVGMKPARSSRELFELADLVSAILRMIETEFFNADPNTELLYRSQGIPDPVVARTMNRIIDLWESAVTPHQRVIKAVRVAAVGSPLVPPAAQPSQIPAGAFTTTRTGATSSNGRAPARL